MAKNLFIVRHAKSDWSFDLRDFDRPLNSRGFRDAPTMADRLSIYFPKTLHLISSPAKRALTTAQIFAEKRAIPIQEIQQFPQIYEASAKELLNLINTLPDNYENVALFGHNPGVSDLINYLTDASIMDIPTCTWAHIHFEIADQWAEVSGNSGQLLKLASPRL